MAVAGLDGVVRVAHITVYPALANVSGLEEGLVGVPALVELEIGGDQGGFLVGPLRSIAHRVVIERCLECGRPSGPEATFWRLYLVADPDEDQESVLAAYCLACAAREFGEARAERRRAE